MERRRQEDASVSSEAMLPELMGPTYRLRAFFILCCESFNLCLEPQSWRDRYMCTSHSKTFRSYSFSPDGILRIVRGIRS